jgi:general secretion pathway protein D
MFQAVKTNKDVNVLSSPQLIATDHEEAMIKVGENIPTKGTTSALLSNSTTTQTSVELVALHLEFKVNPHIGSNGDETRVFTLVI